MLKKIYIVIIATLVLGLFVFYTQTKTDDQKKIVDKQTLVEESNLASNNINKVETTSVKAIKPTQNVQQVKSNISSGLDPADANSEVATNANEWSYEERNKIHKHFFKMLENSPNAQLDKLECKNNECELIYTSFNQDNEFMMDFMRGYTEQNPGSQVDLIDMKRHATGMKIMLTVIKKEP